MPPTRTLAPVLALLVASPVLAEGPARIQVLDAPKPLPAGLRIEGQVVAHLRYSDAAGTHLIVLTETKPKETKARSELEDPTQSKSLYAYAFLETKKRPKLRWRVKDFVLDCAFDLTVQHIEGSLQVTDLDQDGVAEVTFVYQLQCTSDVSPSQIKLIMYEGKDKYAIRGSERVHVGVEDGKPVYVGGESEPDPAFAKAPAALLEHAQAAWRKHAGGPALD